MSYIYKITNLVNGKIYIGQTVHTIEKRFKRHIYDAYRGKTTALAAAIRKYGDKSFRVECIESVEREEDLDAREIYWIQHFDATNREIGYNLTDGGDDTNTYQYKTEEEMSVIKDKIRETKIGGLNPNSRSIKAKNIKTNEELTFASIMDAAKYLNIGEHANQIKARLAKETEYALNGEWLFAYDGENFPTNYITHKNSRKARKVKITRLADGLSDVFDSYAIAERFFELSPKYLSSHAYRYKDKTEFVIAKKFKIEVLE